MALNRFRSGGVQSDIDALKVKSASFSGTTNVSGNVLLYQGNDRIVLSATDTDGNCYAIWMNRIYKYGKAYTVGSDGYFKAKANTQVSGTYYYLEM